MGGLLRIKKVDLFAKGLRSFATFTEATKLQPRLLLWIGGVAEGVCEPLQLLARARLLEDLVRRGAWGFWIGEQKKATTFLLWLSS